VVGIKWLWDHFFSCHKLSAVLLSTSRELLLASVRIHVELEHFHWTGREMRIQYQLVRRKLCFRSSDHQTVNQQDSMSNYSSACNKYHYMQFACNKYYFIWCTSQITVIWLGFCSMVVIHFSSWKLNTVDGWRDELIERRILSHLKDPLEKTIHVPFTIDSKTGISLSLFLISPKQLDMLEFRFIYDVYITWTKDVRVVDFSCARMSWQFWTAVLFRSAVKPEARNGIQI
jgi:hypothetical protein